MEADQALTQKLWSPARLAPTALNLTNPRHSHPFCEPSNHSRAMARGQRLDDHSLAGESVNFSSASIRTGNSFATVSHRISRSTVS